VKRSRLGGVVETAIEKKKGRVIIRGLVQEVGGRLSFAGKADVKKSKTPQSEK